MSLNCAFAERSPGVRFSMLKPLQYSPQVWPSHPSRLARYVPFGSKRRICYPYSKPT